MYRQMNRMPGCDCTNRNKAYYLLRNSTNHAASREESLVMPPGMLACFLTLYHPRPYDAFRAAPDPDGS